MAALNLPSQLTPFIGRANELQEIKNLLADSNCRLLTLIGPGGMGKTRLAVEATRAVIDDYPDGLFFIPLQSLSEPEFIVVTAAESMNLQFYSGRDREMQFFAFLQDKKMLLLMDNFEHLLDGAGLVSRMLESAPNLKVVVTSRERLNLQEEWLYEVGGLPYPPNPESSVDGYSAVQLFAQSARRVNPSFSLTADAAAISYICRLVEGMPLAIELASSWGRVLTYNEIAHEIARGLDILETETRNVPARHRSMRAVMDGSWQHLTETERKAISYLAVFRGGFTREAAEAVVGANARLLATLVDKSWLRHEVSKGRYSIHELVRQYALDQLARSGKSDEANQLHAAYFADFMRRREHDIKCGRQIEGLAELERDFENVRTAWYWAVDHRDYGLLNCLMEALNFYCDMKARFADGEEFFRLAAEPFADSESVEDHLTYIALRARRFRLIVLGSLFMFNEFDSYQGEMVEAVAFARKSGSQRDLAFQLYISAVIAIDMDESRGFSQESAAIYEQLGDEFYYADILTWVAACSVEWQTAKEIFQQTSVIQRRIGDLNGLSWSLQHLSRLTFWDHRLDESDPYLDEAVAIQRARGDLKGLYWSKMNLSQRKLMMGEFETARLYALEARRIASTMKLAVLNQSAMATLGLLSVITESDMEEGERLCHDALATDVGPNFDFAEGPIDASMGLIIAAYHRGDQAAVDCYYECLVRCLDTLDIGKDFVQFGRLALPAALLLKQRGEFTQAVEYLSRVSHLPEEPGYPVMTWLTKMPLLPRLLAELRTQLGDTAYEAAWERGSTMDIRGALPQMRNGIWQTSQSRAVAPVSRDTLTEREVEILRLAAQGLSNNQIAAQLVLSSGTVKWYLSEIYGKLAVSNRAQAIARGHELKLLSA